MHLLGTGNGYQWRDQFAHAAANSVPVVCVQIRPLLIFSCHMHMWSPLTSCVVELATPYSLFPTSGINRKQMAEMVTFSTSVNGHRIKC
jgi:hypothetical protein